MTPRQYRAAGRFRRWLARQLLYASDRVDPYYGFRCMTPYTVTIEHKRGVVFRSDGRGVPLWYMQKDYERIHTESDTDHAIVNWETMQSTFGKQPP